MANLEKLNIYLKKCRQIINKGYTSTKNSGIAWLNSFCAEFLEFTNHLHKFIGKEVGKDVDGNEKVETIFLCLSQILICIKHMERTIKAERTGGVAISASRQHFLDRIHWCIEQLRISLNTLALQMTDSKNISELTFVELMDLALDHLAPYSSYKESDVSNIAAASAEAMFASKQTRSTVDLVISHTLAFANVALKEDKKALSALCQKVLRECISFQDECAFNEKESKLNECNRKLKAMSVENALYQLEDYINEALLRLVYTTFLDHSKYSIEKLRTVIRICDPEDPALDELIADFDVNVDRTTQIGIFAIAFAPNVKIKTVLRSCLASLESLDSCIIPSIQTKYPNDIYSEILEQHFNEEVSKFKSAIQEIIDSHAFTTCYHEMLTQTIAQVEKKFDKIKLQELVQMGEFLYEHFQLKVNYKELKKQDANERLHLFEKFTLMLRECQAILMCADQVGAQRILKRFKILRSIVNKFLEVLNDSSTDQAKKCNNVFIMSEDLSDSQRMFESVGISPSIRSILYHNERLRMKSRTSDSLKANYSKLSAKPKSSISPIMWSQKRQVVSQNETNGKIPIEPRCSIRRKESLRTAMFKRQKSAESENVYKIYRNNSTSLQITDILDQLTNLSMTFSNALQTDEQSVSFK